MATVSRFTEPLAASVRNDSGKPQVVYWEERTRGFGLRVGAHRKAWVVQRDVNGQSRQITLGTYPDMKVEDARRLAKAELAKMQDGVDPRIARRKRRATSSMTLRDALTLYASDAGRDPRTVADFTYALGRYLSDWLDRSLAELGTDDGREEVNARHRQIKADIAAGKFAHKDRKGHPRAQKNRTGEATANHTLVAFRTLWNRAAKQVSSLPVCPTINVTFAKYKPKRNPLPYDQIKGWWDGVSASPLLERRDFLRVALLTGLRANDVRTMRWEHVDLEHATIHIPAPKGGHAFDLPISRRLLTLLKERKAEHERQLKKKLLPEHAAPWCFGAWSESGHIVATDIPVPGIACTPHALRHTFSQVAEFKAGISEQRVGVLMNHRQPTHSVTAIYGRVGVDDLRQPAQAIEDALFLLIEPPASAQVLPLRKRQRSRGEAPAPIALADIVRV